MLQLGQWTNRAPATGKVLIPKHISHTEEHTEGHRAYISHTEGHRITFAPLIYIGIEHARRRKKAIVKICK